MKIAIIGAGSTYTPELVSGLSRSGTRLDICELALHDIDVERRDVVGGLAERMLDRQDFTGNLIVTGDLDRAIEGSDFVLIQIRVGGQQARLSDETIPPECGCVGQETTGAGGFAKAQRTVPVVLSIAERVRQRANPGAWLVDFTNPVGIVTRALLDAGHHAVGLCNVAIGFQRRFAGMLGVPPEQVIIDQIGLNHLTWVRAVRVGTRDVLPDLLDEHGQALADLVRLPLRLIMELGVLPSPYLRYYYRHDEVLRAQQQGEVPRAAQVADIERELLEMYKNRDLAEKPALLDQRGGAYYSEAAVGLMSSLVGDTGDVHVVDIRNNGTLVGLADDDVVEVPARIGADGPVPIPQEPLAPELLGLAQHVAAYERLAAEAAITADAVIARKALLAHPLVGQDEPAAELVERLTEAARALTGARGSSR